MRIPIIVLTVVLAGTALAQSEQKIKSIKAANEAEDKAHNLAQGTHKREAGQPAPGDEGAADKSGGKPKTPKSE